MKAFTFDDEVDGRSVDNDAPTGIDGLAAEVIRLAFLDAVALAEEPDKWDLKDDKVTAEEVRSFFFRDVNGLKDLIQSVGLKINAGMIRRKAGEFLSKCPFPIAREEQLTFWGDLD